MTVREFLVPVVDLDTPVGTLVERARAGLPGALAGVGLEATAPARIGLDRGGLALRVRVAVEPVVPPAPEPAPARVVPVRIGLRPGRRVSRHWAHITAANESAWAIRNSEATTAP